MSEKPATAALAAYFSLNPEILTRKRLGFLHGRYMPELNPVRASLEAEQPRQPYAAELEANGFKLCRELSGNYELILALPGGQREETQCLLARGMSLLKEGGLCVVAMTNDTGAGRYEKNLKELAGSVESMSKFHCRVFWAGKGAALNRELLDNWLEHGRVGVNADGYYTVPGIFSWAETDPGSKLLAGFLPDTFEGEGADLGAGWGYLTAEVLSRAPGVRRAHLIESDQRALHAAKMNIDRLKSKAQIEYHWQDISRGLPVKDLDWIVMNAPFHVGKKTRPELSFKFLEAAAGGLRKGGMLYLVANKEIAYEGRLPGLFAGWEELFRDSRYKVIRAVK